MKHALIICNGMISQYSMIKNKLSETPAFNYTVTVDGGVSHARALGLDVDIAIGDFDSISQENLDYMDAKNIHKETYPSDKDRTDTEIAIDHCISRGIPKVTVIGYTGTRLDHSMANLLMFAAKSSAISITLVNEHNIAYYVHSTIELEAPRDRYVSIIPVTQSVTVKETKGLHYELHNTILYRGKTVGVSNFPEEKCQSIVLSEGIGLITVSHD